MWQENWEPKKKELRAKIDYVDFKIIKLLDERMQYCEEIGEIKAKQGSDVYVSNREQEIFETRQRWGASYGFRSKFVCVLFKVIMFESKRRQKELVKA